MVAPDEFFKQDTFVTLGGASLATLVITNVLRKVFGANALMACFVVSVLICGVAAWEARALTSVMGVVTAIANSALLFCTTTGMQEFTADLATGKRAGEKAEEATAPTSFFRSWFR